MQPSVRPYERPAEPEYPWHDRTIRVTRCGRICIGKRKINFSTVFAGQMVGIREVEDQIWLVSFMDYDLGYFDNERGRVESGPYRGELANRHAHAVRGGCAAVSSVLTGQGVNHVSGIRCKPCDRYTPFCIWRRGALRAAMHAIHEVAQRRKTIT
jgi:putative transposase